LGLRNPFGIAFHPGSGDIFIGDNGPAGQDELNHIVPAGNYGWPRLTGIDPQGQFLAPIYHSGSDTIVPTGMTFYGGGPLPFAGDLFFCSAASGTLLRVEAAEIERVLASSSSDPVGINETGQACLLDVKVGPDGALYLAQADSIYRWGP